ncbi:hypothetical protein L6452_38566 [Arctium lappa]|uniref:Uncharacterized protein n=1 Tax=Arctium lappa TaxID=4217 RepID=A0ACB8XQD7_ARCLA|nr:hypothetical protein L6452_38566 [Arctium lappa]
MFPSSRFNCYNTVEDGTYLEAGNNNGGWNLPVNNNGTRRGVANEDSKSESTRALQLCLWNLKLKTGSRCLWILEFEVESWSEGVWMSDTAGIRSRGE